MPSAKKIKAPVGCTRCSLFRRSKVNCMPGRGNGVRPRVMVIGEAPGATEEARGVPFVGGSGQYLRDILRAAWLKDNEVFFTNACRCRPAGNKTPTPVQLRACWPFLEAEIAAVNPERILLAGAPALASCLGIKGITKLANEPMRWGGRPVMPVLHPAYLLRVLNDRRSPSRYETEATIEAIKKFLLIPLRPAAPAPVVEIHGAEMLGLAFTKMDGPLAVDLETTGLEWETCAVRSVGLSNGKRHIAIPERDFNPKTVKIVYDKLLYARLVGHNLKFDLHFLLNLFEKYLTSDDCTNFKRTLWNRATGGHIFDTMVAAHWLDSSLPKGLKTLAYLYTDHGGYDRDVKDADGHFKQDVAEDVLLRYDGMDCAVTFELMEKFSSRVPAWYYNTIMPLLVATFFMERRGVPINTDYLQKIGVRCVREAAAAKRTTEKLTGDKDFNPNSAQQVAAALQRVGWRPSSWTKKTNAPRVREEDIEGFKHPLSAAILTYRKKTKIKSTYVDNILSRVHGGIVHPSFNLVGTVTGRLSSDNPNFQNIPKGEGIRAAVDPGRGWSVVDGDLSQAELRVLAFFSRDPTMIRAYVKGDDLHAITARAIFNKDEITKAEREIGKRTNFAVVYGEGPGSFAKRLGVSTDDAERYIAGFFKRYPAVRRWMRRVWKGIDDTGWLENMFGLRRRFKWWRTQNKVERARYERESANMPIQGAASEFTSRALVDYVGALVARDGFARFDRGAFPVAIIHDSILVVVPDSAVADGAANLLQETMATTGRYFDKVLPMAADIKVTPRWGEDTEEGQDDGKKEKGKQKCGRLLRKVRKPKRGGAAKPAAHTRVGGSRKKGARPGRARRAADRGAAR